MQLNSSCGAMHVWDDGTYNVNCHVMHYIYPIQFGKNFTLHYPLTQPAPVQHDSIAVGFTLPTQVVGSGA